MASLFFIFGIFSLLSQIIILREISFLFIGHELSIGTALSAWLFWTGAGSFLLSGGGDGSDRNLRGAFHILCLSAAIMPLSVLLARSAVALIERGAVPGLFPMLSFGILLSLPPGLINGMFISSLMRYKELSVSFYIYEALGACAGGLLYPFLAGEFSSIFILMACAAGLILYGLLVFKSMGQVSWLHILDIIFCAAAIYACFFLDINTRRFAYRGMTVELDAETPYAKVAILKNKDSMLLSENGFAAGEFPAPETNEPGAHLALLAHKRPAKILVLGAGGILSLPEILKHSPSVIDIVDPDFKKISLYEWVVKKAAPQLGAMKCSADKNLLAVLKGEVKAECRLSDVKAQGRLNIFIADGRNFLRARNAGDYDVIFQSAPEPVNSGANRFFTLEFFRLARKVLAKNGLLSFSVPSSENYLSPEETYFNASIIKTAREIFAYVRFIPGKRLIILASDSDPDLSAQTLAKRYEERRLKNSVFVPSAFPFFLDAGRRSWMEASLGKAKAVYVNSDFYPVSYFYTWRVWLSKFVSPSFMVGIFASLILAMLALIKVWKLRGRWSQRPAYAALFAAGFWGMSIETILMFLFQSVTGALHWQMGMLFSCFMLGLALGGAVFSWVKIKPQWMVIFMLAFCIVYSLKTADVISRFSAMPYLQAGIFFLILLFSSGFISGAVFPAALRAEENGAKLYAADLWGACLGGMLSSSIFAPLLGFKTAILLSAAPCLAVFIMVVVQEITAAIKTRAAN